MRSTETEPSWGGNRDEVIPQLLATVGARMYRIGLRLCGSPEEAEDLVQEVFLQAWRNWDQFAGKSKVTTWLYTIAAHACQRMHRRRAGEPDCLASFDEFLPQSEPLTPVVLGEDDPQAEALRAEATRNVQEAIAALPGEFRLPVVFKEILGLSIAETAQALGIKPETVKTRLHRARLRLRSVLVESLPKSETPEPCYSKQVCLDLLAAKQEALDRGEPFPVSPQTISERCRSVCQTLDLTNEACRRLADGDLPEATRRRILSSLATD